jgi:hypothetical protein
MGAKYEEEELPWERRGARRLDLEPHRGRLISALGWASLVLGLLSFCVGVTAFVGVPMGIAALVMAHTDLAKMRDSQMDPRGQGRTRRGGDCGLVGALLGLVGGIGFVAFVLDRILPPPYGTGSWL